MSENGDVVPVRLLQDRLAAFLTANPQSRLEELHSPEECFAIVKPWGDTSVVIKVPDAADALVDALNAVVLPTRHTALWHRDTKDFEVIWTAHVVPATFADIVSRNFVFRFRGHEYQCGFGQSSSRLLTIAEQALAVGPTDTEYRNMFSFKWFADKQRDPEHPYNVHIDQPRSFWIRNLEFNEDDTSTVDLVNHINFYMTYYDARTPRIFVHDPVIQETTKPPVRFKEAAFPSLINARDLDSSALYFWEASLAGDAARRFIYNYQIIEYSTFYFIEDSVKRALRRILASPTALDNMEDTLRQVSDAFGAAKMQDNQRMETFLKATVNPALIWAELANNLEKFTSPVSFDGGYVLEALVKPGWNADDFAHAWLPAFPNSIRGIRNALSHGRDQRQLQVIAPTRRNHQLLRPWVAPVSVAAQQVMIYRGLS